MIYEIDSKHIIFNGKNPKVFFEEINEACKELNLSFFIVGAFARDLLLEQIYRQKTGIATRDIDLAIKVDSWNNYDRLIKCLKEKYGYKNGRVAHEFVSSNGMITDIVPFGKIEEGRKISFPPNFTKIINMVGFAEVYQSCIEIIIDKQVKVKIVSLEGIVILKLIAWKDRQPASISQKHTRDIYLIIKNYFDIKVSEFAEEFSDIFDDENYDFLSGGAKVIGRRIGQMSNQSKNLKNNIGMVFSKILENKGNSLFISQLVNGTSHSYEYGEKIVNNLIMGFYDIVKK